MKANLKIDHGLFQRLKNDPPQWWENLKSDSELYIDIRKDNYLNIYYNGGSIMKLEGAENYKAQIHSEFIPLHQDGDVTFSFEDNNINLKEYKPIKIDNFTKESLGKIKKRIKRFFPSLSEKGIQAKFIKKAGQFIDSEFAYDNNELRIDLVWIDIKNKKILFVELKKMGDSRLYTNEIYGQLEKYNNFAIKFEKDIVQYYQKVFEIKKKLGILPKELKVIDSLKDFTLEKKPLLLFGDCKQEWIDNNSQKIDAKIERVAIGAYYFGRPEYSCDLIFKSRGNRHIF